MNRVLLVGRLTRDPEMRTLDGDRQVTCFTVAASEWVDGNERLEYHPIVAHGRLAEVTGTYLGKRQLVAIEGSLHTRSWDDDLGRRHWRTEVIASRVEILSGRSGHALAAAMSV